MIRYKMIEQVLTNSNQIEKTTYKTDKVKEKPLRSIVKSISWRLYKEIISA